MKSNLIFLHVLLLGAVAACSVKPAASQQYVYPSYNYCVQQFYDQSMYGWLAIRNNCSQALSITFAARSGGTGVWGSMDLGAGRQSSTGRSAAEINNAGGLEIYACPKGYVAVDAQDNVIMTRAVSGFRCKQQ
jgi:hypothetical protein